VGLLAHRGFKSHPIRLIVERTRGCNSTARVPVFQTGYAGSIPAIRSKQPQRRSGGNGRRTSLRSWRPFRACGFKSRLRHQECADKANKIRIPLVKSRSYSPAERTSPCHGEDRGSTPRGTAHSTCSCSSAGRERVTTNHEVGGSNPSTNANTFLSEYAVGNGMRQTLRRFALWVRIPATAPAAHAAIAQLEERILGTDEVAGSTPAGGSTPTMLVRTSACFVNRNKWVRLPPPAPDGFLPP